MKKMKYYSVPMTEEVVLDPMESLCGTQTGSGATVEGTDIPSGDGEGGNIRFAPGRGLL